MRIILIGLALVGCSSAGTAPGELAAVGGKADSALAELPTIGVATRLPWGSNAFAARHDGTNVRWWEDTASPAELYDAAFHGVPAPEAGPADCEEPHPGVLASWVRANLGCGSERRDLRTAWMTATFFEPMPLSQVDAFSEVDIAALLITAYAGEAPREETAIGSPWEFHTLVAERIGHGGGMLVLQTTENLGLGVIDSEHLIYAYRSEMTEDEGSGIVSVRTTLTHARPYTWDDYTYPVHDDTFWLYPAGEWITVSYELDLDGAGGEFTGDVVPTGAWIPTGPPDTAAPIELDEVRALNERSRQGREGLSGPVEGRTYESTHAPKDIMDGYDSDAWDIHLSGATHMAVRVPRHGIVDRVEVSVDVEHDRPEELRISLTHQPRYYASNHPETAALLHDGEDVIETEHATDAFRGLSSEGVWFVKVADTRSGGGHGTLGTVTIRFTGSE